MLTAKKAKTDSRKNRVNAILNKIQGQAFDGYFHCHIDNNLMDYQTMVKLKKLGFKWQSEPEKGTYKIKWD